jgi:MFS family permease
MLVAIAIPLAGGDPILLALLGFSGMVAVASNEATGLQTVDQAALPQTVPPHHRTRAFALYNVVAVVASAAGSLVAGLIPGMAAAAGLEGPSGFAPAFVLYAVCGLAAAIAAIPLDRRIEVSTPVSATRRLGIHRSRGMVARLSLLFGVDALAGALVVNSFLAYWFTERFDADPALLGVLFLAAGLLAAASFPVAAWLSERIGLIATMVFSHIPANIFLIAMALAPALPLATVFFLARSALSSMDIPARQSYTMAVVEPDERTAAAGVTGLARSLAQVPGPALASLLLGPFGLAAPLVASGLLKIGYDLTLFAMFRQHPAPEEEIRRQAAAVAAKASAPSVDVDRLP